MLISKSDFKRNDFLTKFTVEDSELFLDLSFSENVINNCLQDFLIDASFLELMDIFIVLNFFFFALISLFKIGEKEASELSELSNVVIWSNNVKNQSDLLFDDKNWRPKIEQFPTFTPQMNIKYYM